MTQGTTTVVVLCIALSVEYAFILTAQAKPFYTQNGSFSMLQSNINLSQYVKNSVEPFFLRKRALAPVSLLSVGI